MDGSPYYVGLEILDVERLQSLLGLLCWKLQGTKIQKLTKCCST